MKDTKTLRRFSYVIQFKEYDSLESMMTISTNYPRKRRKEKPNLLKEVETER